MVQPSEPYVFNPNGLLQQPELKKEAWRDRPRIEAPLVPETPLIGNFGRKPANTLLIKPELGKGKQSTYRLPGPAHTYGKALFREDEGTGEMIMTWMEHTPNPHARPGRDFKALNKHAVVAGATTAKQQLEFRKTHDARLKVGTQEDRRFRLADDFVHGVATRPSTPITELIASAYRWSWVADHLDLEGGGKTKAKKLGSPATTKASRGHASTAQRYATRAAADGAQATIKPPFVMKRFQNVPAKVTSYMPPRPSAMKPHASAESSGEAEAAVDASQSQSQPTQQPVPDPHPDPVADAEMEA